MNIRALRTFLEIADQQSFAKAALRLNYAQSSVTAQIKVLEEDLGEKLFTRDRNGASLTEAGHRFFPFAQQILNLEACAREEVQSIPSYSGNVVISSMESISSYRLPKFFGQFQNAAPDAKIIFKTVLDAEIYGALKTGTTDVAFVIERDINLDFVNAVRLTREGVSLYVSSAHPLAGQTLDMDALAQQRFLLWGQKGSYITAFERHFFEKGHTSLKTIDIINAETIKQCAIEGVGVALMLDISVQKEVARGDLVRLDWDMPVVFHSYMVWNKYKRLSQTARFFIQMCRKHFEGLSLGQDAP